jgi:threonine/homoserine/homoserine lactone efflux protein
MLPLVDIISVLPAFLVAVLVIAASPGPAMALIFQRAGLHGFRAAVPTVLGIEAGLWIWALAAGAGLAALVAASETAFIVLKVVGAVFLVYLGIKSLRSGWALRDRGGVEALPEPPAARSGKGAFAEGLIVQLANPKAAAFMFAFYPQFVPKDGPVLLTTMVLATIQVAVELVLYLGLAHTVGRASAWFSKTKIRRRLDYISGAVLVLLGLRVATATR